MKSPAKKKTLPLSLAPWKHNTWICKWWYCTKQVREPSSLWPWIMQEGSFLSNMLLTMSPFVKFYDKGSHNSLRQYNLWKVEGCNKTLTHEWSKNFSWNKLLNFLSSPGVTERQPYRHRRHPLRRTRTKYHPSGKR